MAAHSAVASQARLVSGASEPAQQEKGKKGKPVKSTNGSHAASNPVSKAAQAATLMDKAPSRDQLPDSVKVQPADLAEQAEQQTALAVVDMLENNQQSTVNGHGPEVEDKEASVLVTTIHKRIKVLNKKLQRATSYAQLPEDKLNADMKRIIDSKGNFEGAVAELTETLKAIELSEKEHKRQQAAARKEIAARTKPGTEQKSQKKLHTLFQLMHLNSLIHASMQASFAPPPLPTVLQNATSQQVAAVGKLCADLSASAEVMSSNDKTIQVDKLVAGSSDEVLPGVAFKDLMALVDGLSTSTLQQTVVQQPSRESGQPTPATEAAAPPHILFMQASELEQSSSAAASANDAPADVPQAEPEGGAVDGVAPYAVHGGASAWGHEGAVGAVPGKPQVNGAHEDGTAKAEVKEPVRTTEVTASQFATPAPKVIDWSANDDDDDFGDLEMQPETVKPATADKQAVPSHKDASERADDTTKGRERGNQQRQVAMHQREHSKQHQQQQQQQRGKQHQQQQQAPALMAKPTPLVDEDGFIVASSKRTKMLQQQQAQTQRGRGYGRGGFRGGASSGGRGAGRGGANGGAPGRGRGRGRGGAPAEQETS